MSVPFCLLRDPFPCMFSSHVAAAALSYQGAMRVLCDPDLMVRLDCADPRLLSRKYGLLRALNPTTVTLFTCCLSCLRD